MSFGDITRLLKERMQHQSGTCIGCDAPLPTEHRTKPRTLLCGDKECERLYFALRRGLSRELAQAAIGQLTGAREGSAVDVALRGEFPPLERGGSR